MKDKILLLIMEMILKAVKPEMIEKVADKALDFVEVWADKSDNEFVDGLCEIVREAFDIDEFEE